MIDFASTKAPAERRTKPDEYLGPAEVVEVRSNDALVALPEGDRVGAAFAFVLPYTPNVGDVLLVIGRAGRHYAIGVLHGTGNTAFVLQGDVDVRAVQGKLRLSGDLGVEVRGPVVDVEARSLRMIARDVVQRFDSVCQRVSSLIRLHAGESQTVVDGSSFTQANRAAILTNETVTINGREVHLG